MPSDPDLLNLIQTIYETPLNANKWTESLDLYAEAVGATGASLAQISMINPSDNSFAELSSIYTPEIAETYATQFAHYEQLGWETMTRSKPYVFHSDRDVWPDLEAFSKRPDVTYLRNTVGVFHRGGARISLTPAYCSALNVQFHHARPGLQSHEHEVMQQLMPHFTQAVELDRTLRHSRLVSASLQAAFDRILFGLVILSKSGEPIFINASAAKIIEAGDGIMLTRQNAILPTQASLEADFNNLLAQALRQRASPQASGPLQMTFPRKSKRAPYIIEAYPLVDGNNDIDRRHVGTALFIIDTEETDIIRSDGLSLVYNLSQAETEILDLIVQGLSNAEIADVRSVGVETIKTQTKSLYQKAEVTSRIELVRDALKVNLPLRREDA